MVVVQIDLLLAALLLPLPGGRPPLTMVVVPPASARRRCYEVPSMSEHRAAAHRHQAPRSALPPAASRLVERGRLEETAARSATCTPYLDVVNAMTRIDRA